MWMKKRALLRKMFLATQNIPNTRDEKKKCREREANRKKGRKKITE